MRQKTQSPEDASLWTALVNMCYGACTPGNIKFLRKRIAGTHPDQLNVASKNFRNVAIICGVHSQKDYSIWHPGVHPSSHAPPYLI